ncbi:unnamed protein product [Linum trigynum]|uniref:Uncharacterized protein n=1 Tax=Linum trigynum TaxID=586398 RepID=A0AAV2DXL3_9ROSI
MKLEILNPSTRSLFCTRTPKSLPQTRFPSSAIQSPFTGIVEENNGGDDGRLLLDCCAGEVGMGVQCRGCYSRLRWLDEEERDGGQLGSSLGEPRGQAVARLMLA